MSPRIFKHALIYLDYFGEKYVKSTIFEPMPFHVI